MGLVEMKSVLEGAIYFPLLCQMFKAFVTFPCGYLRILESAMAVAQMLLDAETIYMVSNELIAAKLVPAA